MALASYEHSADVAPLRALGVSEIVPRPWLVSKVRGGIGLAATSLAPRLPARALASAQSVDGAMPLMSECPALTLSSLAWRLDACALFFGDAPGYAPVRATRRAERFDRSANRVDRRAARISGEPRTRPRNRRRAHPVGASAAGRIERVAARVRARIAARSERQSTRKTGRRVRVVMDSARRVSRSRAPASANSSLKRRSCRICRRAVAPAQGRAFAFRRILPWLYVVDASGDAAARSQQRTPAVLRFNERYDPGWLAFASGRVLRHVRVDLAVNGWFLGALPQTRRSGAGDGVRTSDCRICRYSLRAGVAEGARPRADEAHVSDDDHARSFRRFKGAVPRVARGASSAHNAGDGGRELHTRTRRRRF